jgi:hypothetical protein
MSRGHADMKDPNCSAAALKSSSIVLFPQRPALQLIYALEAGSRGLGP